MKKISTILTALLLSFSIQMQLTASPENAPKITVVLIADQFAHFYLPKLQKYFKHGLKQLLEEGVVYDNVFHPHGTPETTTGHHTLSTGCYPKDHGGVTNQWLDRNGKKVRYEADNNPQAELLPAPPTFIGKSSHNTPVDTLCDQFVSYTTIPTPTKAYVISLKDYAAIATAGRLGKPCWFDEQRGIFVTSKKYFDHTPSWITDFNKTLEKKYFNTPWRLCYDQDNACYNFPFIKNYDFAAYKESFINKTYKTAQTGKSPYYFIMRSPVSNQMIFDLAKKCIEKKVHTDKNDRMLLWLSLSQLDLLTHLFGPDSLETTDTIYHLDKQIGDFMHYLHKRFGKENCLIAFTSDHGVAPIPELQKLKGYPNARRIMAQTLIDDSNKHLQKIYGNNTYVKAFEPNSFILDDTTFQNIAPEKAREIKHELCSFLRSYPGIKNAWTYEELQQKNTHHDCPTKFHKMQCYQGRIGDIICLTHPHCQITAYPTGTSHCTPYNYDTHVPLILHHPQKLTHKIIHKRILTPQIPVALAHLLHINPSAGTPFSTISGLNK